MSGQKLQPFVGEDGRIYYNYGIGAKYRLEDNGEEYIYEIVDCSYNGTEYYTIERNGEKAWRKDSANRVHYLLHFGLLETLSEGKRREFPLTVEEVTTYYKRKTQERADAFKSLGNTDYSAKSKELQSIAIEKGIAEAREQSERVAELTKRETELRAKQLAILKTKKIDSAVLKGVKFCDKCGSTGVNGLQVCDCAKKMQAEIKEYNAILRRVMRAQANG